jgi:hypothetical protein
MSIDREMCFVNMTMLSESISGTPRALPAGPSESARHATRRERELYEEATHTQQALRIAPLRDRADRQINLSGIPVHQLPSDAAIGKFHSRTNHRAAVPFGDCL